MPKRLYRFKFTISLLLLLSIYARPLIHPVSAQNLFFFEGSEDSTEVAENWTLTGEILDSTDYYHSGANSLKIPRGLIGMANKAERVSHVHKDDNPILSGAIAFEILEKSEVLIDNVEIIETNIEDVFEEPTLQQILGTSFVLDVVHTGDLIISGHETMVIEDTEYFQQGNVYINDEAKLIIRNSQFMLGRGDVPTIHTSIFVAEKASLIVENSTIFPYQPPDGMGGLVVICNEGNTNITDSPTSIHVLEVCHGAQLNIVNSEMVFEIGGLLQVEGGNTQIVNSTIGAIGLNVPANSHLDVSEIESGVYLESWDIHDIIPDVNYDLVLEKTSILKDELEPGPYERGWIFFIASQAHARISNSELRKVFITFQNEETGLENLRVGVPSGLKYRDIELNDVIIKGQWGIELIDSNVTISNSDYLFIQISGQSNLNMIGSHMVEFIPRDFFGTITFENCTWTNAGEIIGGQPYHSMGNNFTIRGSLKISPELKEHLQWYNASVRRIYDVFILDVDSQPIKGVSMIIDGKRFLTDDSGKAEFTLIFSETNYLKPRELEVMEEDKTIAKYTIDFFTETPIIIIRASGETSLLTQENFRETSLLIRENLAVIVVALAVVVYSSKKRKPPTPTAPPLPTDSTPLNTTQNTNQKNVWQQRHRGNQ
ncbi:MAG: hypothetical protein ACFFCZ_27135 [Promethearchaeota archaeon]